jgi:hypothetical protein
VTHLFFDVEHGYRYLPILPVHSFNFVCMRFFHIGMLLVTLIWAVRAMGQTPDSVVVQPNTPLMRKLLHSPNVVNINTVIRQGIGNLDIGVPMHTNHPFDLYKKKNGLYAHISATGIIYRISEIAGGDSIVFRRLDKTTHFGYNINAFGFTMDGRIYNFGGYGYWRWNGQMREYNDRMKEWHIIALERELPVVNGGPNSFIWLDSAGHRIFVLRYLQGNEAVQNDPQRWADTAFTLRLKDMKWIAVGLTPKIEVSNDIEMIFTSLDSGLLMHTNGGIEYWNYLSNRVKAIANDSIRAELLTQNGNQYYWYEKGQLFISNALTGALDSLKLIPGDFVDTDRTVFIPFEQSIPYKSVMASVMAAFTFLFIWVRRIRRRTVKPSESKIIIEPAESTPVPVVSDDKPEDVVLPVVFPHATVNQELFDAVESSLLKLLHQHSLEPGRTTTTQEVNRILGVGNKTLDMQKRKRSDVLRAINRKYQLVFPERTGELILKDRSEQDGRQTEYRINPTEIDVIRELLQKI